jgi:hypothetical protein
MSNREKELAKKLFAITQSLLKEEGELGSLGLAIHVALLCASSGKLNDFMEIVVNFIEEKAKEESLHRSGIFGEKDRAESALDNLIKEIGGISLN